MFHTLAKACIYAATLTPLLLIKPLFFPFITGKAIGFRVCVEIALLFFCCYLLTQLHDPTFFKKLLQRLKHPIVICVAVLTLMIIITALLSENPTQAFWSNFERGEGAFQMLHYGIFFVLAVLLFNNRESLNRLLLFTVVVSLPISLYALLQLVTPIVNNTNLFVVAPGERVSGTLGNPSYLAAYLIFVIAFVLYFLITNREYVRGFTTYLLTIPGAAGLMLYLAAREWGFENSAGNNLLDELFVTGIFWYLGISIILYMLSVMDRQKFQQWSLAAIGLFSLYILLKTGTRGAFLGLVAGILVVAVVNFLTTKNKKIQFTLGGIFAGGLLLAMMFFATPQAPVWQKIPVFGRLINLNSALNDIKPRIWTWQSALKGFAEKPIAGWGAENFPDAFDKYYNPNHYGIESFFDRTHNIFLEYAITGGLLVLIPWLAIFFYYYRRLQRHPKNFWYSIMFTIPIMHLVQGFFLFDTLPIYIGFFLFLVLAITTEQHTEQVPTPRESHLSGVSIATAGALTLGCAAVLYYTAYLPLQKNLMIVNALRQQNGLSVVGANGQPVVRPDQVITAFHTAMNLYSPIGQEEAIGMHQKFILTLVENVTANPQAVTNANVRAEVRSLIEDANRWFDSNPSLYPGLKAQYINGGLNLRTGVAFNQPDLLARGKKMFADALAQAPNRIEFIDVLIELAKLENDQQALNQWGRRANALRPDRFKLQEIDS